MEEIIFSILICAGAVAWLTTTLVSKPGPFQLVIKFKRKVNRILGNNTPLNCFQCASFWISLIVGGLFFLEPIRPVIYLFSIAGFGQMLRGQSGEWMGSSED